MQRADLSFQLFVVGQDREVPMNGLILWVALGRTYDFYAFYRS